MLIKKIAYIIQKQILNKVHKNKKIKKNKIREKIEKIEKIKLSVYFSAVPNLLSGFKSASF